MTAGFLKRCTGLLASPRLATLLLAAFGAWAALASIVGAQHAFTSPPFLVLVSMLAVSTGVCAWQRTRVAVRRAGMLKRVRELLPDAGEAQWDFAIECDPSLDTAAVLDIAEAALARAGLAARRDGTCVCAASPAWSVWGSPVFHWALVAAIVVIPLGGLVRSSGQMGLAVGQTAPDQPSSYGVLDQGPLRDWGDVTRQIRVDEFDVNCSAGGVDRGPTPTVSVLDADGEVIASQLVYPNKTLKTGSLAVYPADYGLATTVELTDASGTETKRVRQLVDFSGSAEGGTAPMSALVLEDANGETEYRMLVSVPLDPAEGGGYLARLPEAPRARIKVENASGGTAFDEEVRPGETVALPVGGTLRLLDVGYYARLQLVDDPSIPVLYLVLALAVVGLGVTTLAEQMLLVASPVETAERIRLLARLRLWRTLSVSRAEIEAELRAGLQAPSAEEA